jgi:excisionase family DNA binding protein
MVEQQYEQLQFEVLMDVEGVARMLAVGVRYVYGLVATKQIEFIKLGHYLRFEYEAVLRYIAEHRQPVADVTPARVRR